jgi:ParB/RepB/Spo0J family partition protein
MTTPTKEPEQIQHVSVELIIVPKGHNPRKAFDPAKLQELADSIKSAGGIQQPLILRNDRACGVSYSLVAGERRLRAAKLLGLATVPAIVREMTDEQALQIALVENLQREDLTPLEEIDGLARLRDQHKLDIGRIQELTGKSRSHVYDTLKLAAAAPAIRTALAQGDLDRSRALILTRLPPALQAGALKSAQEDQWDGQPLSVRDLTEEIERKWRADLNKAAFPLQDTVVTTPPTPICATCPHRSDGQLGQKGGINCYDVACFKRKQDAGFKLRAAEATAAGHKIVDLQDSKQAHAARRQDYAELSDHSWEIGTSNESYAKAIKKKGVDVPRYLVRDGDGGVQLMIRRDEADRLLSGGKGDSSRDRYKASQAASLAAAKLDAAVTVAAIQQIGQAAQVGLGSDLAFWRLAAHLKLHACHWDSERIVLKARGAKGDTGERGKVLGKMIDDGDAATARAILVQLLALGTPWLGEGTVKRAAAHWKIDLAAIKRQLVAEKTQHQAKAKAGQIPKAATSVGPAPLAAGSSTSSNTARAQSAVPAAAPTPAGQSASAKANAKVRARARLAAAQKARWATFRASHGKPYTTKPQ